MSHIKSLKAKCLHAINIIKYLSHTRTGCNRKLLLQLYKSLIRSQLDYGATIHRQCSKSKIKLFDTIQASTQRMALGAFRKSAHLSLWAEAAEPPLHFRTLILTANFLALSFQIPAFQTSTHSPSNFLLSSWRSDPQYLPKLSPLLPIKPSTPP